MLRAPQYRRRRHSRRRLFLADQIAITYLKPDARETVAPKNKGYSKQFSIEFATRMIATQAQVPVCGCCGEDASTVFEAIAMIYTSGERPLCDTCWQTQGTESARGSMGWMHNRYHRKKLLEEEEENLLTIPHE